MTSASLRRARKRERKALASSKDVHAPKAKEAKMDPQVLGGQLLETSTASGKLTTTVQINRLPEGFFENELADFFEQFGHVKATRVWRNSRSGGSKGVAWVHFADAKVALIAAETMNNYLCFGKIMKVRVLRTSQVPAKLFDRKFERAVEKDWSAIKHVNAMNAVKSDETKAKSARRTAKRANAKTAKLATLLGDGDEAKLPLESFRSLDDTRDTDDCYSMIIDSDDGDLSFGSLPNTVVVSKRTPASAKKSIIGSAKKTKSPSSDKASPKTKSPSSDKASPKSKSISKTPSSLKVRKAKSKR